MTSKSRFNPHYIVGVPMARDGEAMPDSEKLKAGKTRCDGCITYLASDQVKDGETLCSACMRNEPFGANSRRKMAHGNGYYTSYNTR
tara:strand:- start:5042 stop:5302 length:261 start_codon:yes stop_codon:yes gene_type:complete